MSSQQQTVVFWLFLKTSFLCQPPLPGRKFFSYSKHFGFIFGGCWAASVLDQQKTEYFVLILLVAALVLLPRPIMRLPAKLSPFWVSNSFYHLQFVGLLRKFKRWGKVSVVLIMSSCSKCVSRILWKPKWFRFSVRSTRSNKDQSSSSWRWWNDVEK